MSGRRPAYVPTTSARVRSTSIVALTVSSSRSTSQPAADGWAAGPSNGASVVPISQWSGHGTRKTILPGHPDGQAHRVGDALARHDEVGAAARQDAQRAALERVVGLGRPDAGRVDDGAGPDLELRCRSSGPRRGARRCAPVAPIVRRPVALTRVTATPTGGDRRPSDGQRVAGVVLDPVVVDETAAQSVAIAGSGRGRACRPSTAADASRRRGAHRGRRTASARRRRTPSRRYGMP